MTDPGTEHRAAYWPGTEPGTYDGGCRLCGMFYGETDVTRADAYCNGHNSAVAGLARNPGPLWFPPVGPGDAITVSRLAYVLSALLGAGDIPADAEIVQPAAFPPILFVWTPPSAEGWQRTRYGALIVEKSGSFVREPTADAVGYIAVPRNTAKLTCEACGCDVVDGRCEWCDGEEVVR